MPSFFAGYGLALFLVAPTIVGDPREAAHRALIVAGVGLGSLILSLLTLIKEKGGA